MLLAALVLAPETAQARYLNPGTGRFQTMDSYEGNDQEPTSQHKYLYGSDNPINLADPSGHLVEEPLVTTSFQRQVQTTSAVSTGAARTRAITQIINAAALSALLANQAGLFDSNPSATIDRIKEKNPNYLVFLHATSTGAWPELTMGGLPQINPNLGLGKDFGRGFYTFNASSADPRVLPSAIAFAWRTASEDGGTPIVTIWLIKLEKYRALTRANFGALPAVEYSKLVGAFRDRLIETTGRQLAFGEIAKKEGAAWVRNFQLPFQYKFEGSSGVKNLISAGGFSPEPMH